MSETPLPDLDGPHESQAWAAAHLAGELDPGRRERFATHLLRCEACWSEVRAARDGRALAEELRESAAQDLREYVRALAAGGSPAPEQAGITTLPDGGPAAARIPRRRRWLTTAAAAVAGAVLAGGLTVGLLSSDPTTVEAPLVAAAAAYRADPASFARTDPPPTRRLGALTWQGTTREDLAGRPAIAYRYADGAGRSLLLVSSEDPFPRAKHASPVVGSSWTASIDGVVMFCVDHGGLSWLVIGESAQDTVEAGRQAGLA